MKHNNLESLMVVVYLRNVTKIFGDFHAVHDLSFSISTGIMYEFLGPNSAGKTTTIHMIMDIIMADRGDIEILGKEVHRRYGIASVTCLKNVDSIAR